MAEGNKELCPGAPGFAGECWTIDGRRWEYVFGKDEVAYCRAAIIWQAVDPEGYEVDEPSWEWSAELYPISMKDLLVSEPEKFIDPRIHRDMKWAQATLDNMKAHIEALKVDRDSIQRRIGESRAELREVELKVEAIAKYAPEVEAAFAWLEGEIYYFHEASQEIIKGKPFGKLHLHVSLGRYPSDKELNVSVDVRSDHWEKSNVLFGVTREAVLEHAVREIRKDLKSKYSRAIPEYEFWKEQGANFYDSDENLYLELKAKLESEQEAKKNNEVDRLARQAEGLGYKLTRG